MSEVKQVLEKFEARKSDQSAELLRIANEILKDFQDKPEGRNSRGSDIQRAEINTNYRSDRKPVAEAGIRYFGDWMVPEDEEDDGDYDWKIPTPKTRDLISKMLKNRQKKYKKYDIRISTEEKEWIIIVVGPKTR